jgi:hypothetical protein
MLTFKPLIAAGLLALGLLAAPGARAAETDTHYAVVGISNPTHLTINYAFRWRNCEWRTFQIAPGGKRWHSWRYDYPNENESPVPQIKFDCDLSEDVSYLEYALTAFASPVEDYYFGKKYKFVTRGHGAVLDLVSIN